MFRLYRTFPDNFNFNKFKKYPHEMHLLREGKVLIVINYKNRIINRLFKENKVQQRYITRVTPFNGNKLIAFTTAGD